MRCLVLPIMLALLILSVACSSSGTGKIVIDGYGNTSGYWQFVIDDNGYVTRIWVDIKPGEIYSDASGNMYKQDSLLGFISESNALLLMNEEYVSFDVQWLDANSCKLTSEYYPPILATRTIKLEVP